MIDLIYQNFPFVLEAPKHFLITGIFWLAAKIAKYFMAREHWRDFDTRVLFGTIILILGSGVAHWFLQSRTEIVFPIKVKREIGERDNGKIYCDCEETVIYVDGKRKGTASAEVNTHVGKHWLHLRYETNPFYREFGPDEVLFLKKHEKEGFFKRLHKKRGTLQINIPTKAFGKAVFRIEGDGFKKIKTSNIRHEKIPFGYYCIIGEWGNNIDVDNVVVFDPGVTSASLFEEQF